LANLLNRALKKNRQKAYARGYVAENLAAFYLRCKGYTIVARRFKKPFGEIDIIARRNNTLIACEVKSRKNLEEALYAVSEKQKRRIKNTLEAFVMERPKFSNYIMRVDVLLVTSFYLLPYHLKNAW
jgi:putative endonuclease